jgi:hypothetical protein
MNLIDVDNVRGRNRAEFRGTAVMGEDAYGDAVDAGRGLDMAGTNGSPRS